MKNSPSKRKIDSKHFININVKLSVGNAINLIPTLEDSETESIMKPMFKTMKGEIKDIKSQADVDDPRTPIKQKKMHWKKKPKKIKNVEQSTLRDETVEGTETTSELE